MSPAGLEVTGVQFTPASRADRDRGLEAYLRVELAGVLVVDGVTLRRTAAGAWVVSFPARTDRSGQRHPLVRVLDRGARRRLEVAVLERLGLRPDGGEVAR